LVPVSPSAAHSEPATANPGFKEPIEAVYLNTGLEEVELVEFW